MSTTSYTTCDMCGREERRGTSMWGTFHSCTWEDEDELFDLCPECCERVQRFIRDHEFADVRTRRASDGDE